MKAENEWQEYRDEGELCPQKSCKRPPFRFRVEGTFMVYQCKCGEEWDYELNPLLRDLEQAIASQREVTRMNADICNKCDEIPVMEQVLLMGARSLSPDKYESLEKIIGLLIFTRSSEIESETRAGGKIYCVRLNCGHTCRVLEPQYALFNVFAGMDTIKSRLTTISHNQRGKV